MTTALQRIQVCKEKRSTILDLGDCGLTDDNIPEELWDLEWLEELNLGNHWYYDEEKKSWEWKPIQGDKNQLTKIPVGLGSLTNLNDLNLSENQIPKN